MDKNKTLKNSSENIALDTKEREKESDLSDNISSSRKPEYDDESSDSKNSNDYNNSVFDFDNFNLNLIILDEVSKIAHMGMNSISFLINRKMLRN